MEIYWNAPIQIDNVPINWLKKTLDTWQKKKTNTHMQTQNEMNQISRNSLESWLLLIKLNKENDIVRRVRRKQYTPKQNK